MVSHRRRFNVAGRCVVVALQMWLSQVKLTEQQLDSCCVERGVHPVCEPEDLDLIVRTTLGVSASGWVCGVLQTKYGLSYRNQCLPAVLTSVPILPASTQFHPFALTTCTCCQWYLALHASVSPTLLPSNLSSQPGMGTNNSSPPWVQWTGHRYLHLETPRQKPRCTCS